MINPASQVNLTSNSIQLHQYSNGNYQSINHHSPNQKLPKSDQRSINIERKKERKKETHEDYYYDWGIGFFW